MKRPILRRDKLRALCENHAYDLHETPEEMEVADQEKPIGVGDRCRLHERLFPCACSPRIVLGGVGNL